MRTLLALAWLALLLSPRAAIAQVDDPADRARTHLKAGISYYDEGRYADAAREMEAAYSLKPLPDLLYNVAQCYERLNRLGDAAGAYRKYLEGKPGAEDRKSIEARIANLDERVKQEAAGTAPSTPLPPPTEKVVFKTIIVYRETPPPPGRATRWAAYGVAILALASLGTGIAFTILAKQNSDFVTKGDAAHMVSPGMPMPFDGKASEAQAALQSDQIIAGVSYGVAGVAALGAIGLYVLGNKIDREAPKVTLAPSLSPTGGGFAIAGTF
jgi:iron complex outermembrane receptor protein